MATWIYPFQKFEGGIIRPWINVKIVNPINNKEVSVMALLDTGADHCVFPQFVCERLGIDLKDKNAPQEEMQGLADTKVLVWKHTFRINLDSPDKRTTVWKSKDLIIGCVEHDNIPPILGFSNFMCKFKITFNHATQKIILDDRPII